MVAVQVDLAVGPAAVVAAEAEAADTITRATASIVAGIAVLGRQEIASRE